MISGRKALPSGLVSKLWLGIGCRHSQVSGKNHFMSTRRLGNRSFSVPALCQALISAVSRPHNVALNDTPPPHRTVHLPTTGTCSKQAASRKPAEVPDPTQRPESPSHGTRPRPRRCATLTQDAHEAQAVPPPHHLPQQFCATS